MKKPVCQQYGCHNKYHLKGCRYCHRSFCLAHRNAFPPSGAFEGEWPPKGHPCSDYVATAERKRQNEFEKAYAALDNYLRKPVRDKYILREKKDLPNPLEIDEEVEDKPIPSSSYDYYDPKPSERPKKILSRKTVGLALIVILIGVLLWFLYYHPNTNSQIILLSKPCADETVSGACSQTKPFYCENGAFIKKPEVCGCQEGYRSYQGDCIKRIECSDGTLAPECSITKPLQCVNGVLRKNATLCGCPDDFLVNGTDCRPIPKCSDGTKEGECSISLGKPYFCNGQILVKKASPCGCPEGRAVQQVGEDCVDLSKPDIAELEKQIHDLINVERVRNGLPSLSLDDRLSTIARVHSRDMAVNHFFSHDNLNGQDPTDRANSAGYTCYKNYGSYYTNGIAENIAQNNLYSSVTYVDAIPSSYDWNTPEQIAASVVNGWMNSPGHRQNILTSAYDREGMGVAIASDDKVYITQDFC